MNAPVILDRRRVLTGGGALIVSFSLTGALAQQQEAPAAAPAPKPPGSLATTPYLDSWVRIDADGGITALTGKAELGQGFRTAFQQIAAEELSLPMRPQLDERAIELVIKEVTAAVRRCGETDAAASAIDLIDPELLVT